MISSEDIKAWLVAHYQEQGIETRARDWKRHQKHRDEVGRVHREFKHPSIGTVGVLEANGGWVLDGVNSANPGVFSRPVLPAAAMAAAQKIWERFQADPNALEDLTNDPQYLEAYLALPSLFSFCFPSRSYGNDGAEEQSVHEAAGGLTIRVLAIEEGGYDYSTNLILDRLEEDLGLMSDDENHWSIPPSNKQTVLEWVQHLMTLGLLYEPSSFDSCGPCLFEEELVALGAMTPFEGTPAGLVSATHRALQKALVSDDFGAVLELLAELGPEASTLAGNDGTGRTWVEAAFEHQAFLTLVLLLKKGAPVHVSSRNGILGSEGPWRRLCADEVEVHRQLMQAIVKSTAWIPDRAWPGPADHGKLERDAWAGLVFLDAKVQDVPWIETCWDALTYRAGQEQADESFVRAWLDRLRWDSGGALSSALSARAMAAILRTPSILHAWPDRCDKHGYQALSVLGGVSESFSMAAEIALGLGVDLPALPGPNGRTLLENARDEQEDAYQRLQNMVERESGRTRIVLIYADGRRLSQVQEHRQRWQKAMGLQKGLEGFSIGASRRKPKP